MGSFEAFTSFYSNWSNIPAVQAFGPIYFYLLVDKGKITLWTSAFSNLSKKG